ncbi:MAG: protein kinase [Bryobacteraceae bacterium]|nr:protein kinase [Bryobacteraceae bacterium]
MLPTDPKRWQRLKEIFEQAIEKEPAGREAFLDSIGPDDADLQPQVRRLLALHEESNLVVDSPAADLGRLMPAPVTGGRLLNGRFRIVRELGSGGMGSVYEAEDSALGGTRVALKMILDVWRNQPAVMDRFKQELQILRSINHQNVCRVYDFFPGSGGEPAFFTMELLEGETLAERLKRTGAAGVDQSWPIICQIVEGLRAAHAAGVIHRDLKPANIMVCPGATGGTRVVLMDFGIARGVRAAGAAPVTEPGVALGTPAYMAPEQIEGNPATPATDIYGLGAVLFEMLAGKPAFEASNPLGVVAKKFTTRPSFADSRVEIPYGWQRVVLRCLARDPSHRYASVEDVLKALGEASLRPPRPSRMPRWLPWAAGILLLAAGYAGYQYWRHTTGPPAETARLYRDGVLALADAAPHRASRLFSAAIERSPGFAAAHARHAQALAALDQPDQAREAMLRSVDLQGFKWLLPAYERDLFDAVRSTVTRDFDQAVERFRIAADNAPEKDRETALLDLAHAQEQNEDTAGAGATYRRVLELNPRQPTAHLHLGMLAARDQQIEPALRHFAQAQEGYELLGNSEAVAETWLRRGMAYDGVSRFKEAREALEAGRKYAESNRLALQQVRALFNLSAVALRSGDMPEAQRLSAQAVELAEKERQEAQLVFALNDLAAAHLTQLRLKETEELARRALDLARRYRQPQSGARALLLMANVHYYRAGKEDLAKAGQLAREALGFYKQAGYRRQQLSALLLLARAENGADRFREAEPLWREALTAADSVHDSRSAGLALQGLGTAARAMGRYQEAADFFRRAAAEYGRSHLPGNIPYALMAQGEILWHIADPAIADGLLKQAEELSKTNPRVLAMIALVRAGLEASNENWAQTRVYLDKAKAVRDDESAGRFARIVALEALLASRGEAPGDWNVFCRQVAATAARGLAFDDRVFALLQCGLAADPAAAAFLAPELRNLAEGAAKLGNDAVAWQAWMTLARVDQKVRQEAAGKAQQHLAAMRKSWGDIAVEVHVARPDLRHLTRTD